MSDDGDFPSSDEFNYDGGRLSVRLRRLRVSRYLARIAPGALGGTGAFTSGQEIASSGDLRPHGLVILGRQSPAASKLLVVLTTSDEHQQVEGWQSARSSLTYGIQYADHSADPLGSRLMPLVAFIEKALPDFDAELPTAQLSADEGSALRQPRTAWSLMARVPPTTMEKLSADILAGYRPKVFLGVTLRTALSTCHESWRRGDEPKLFGVLALPMAGATAFGWVTHLRWTLRPLSRRHSGDSVGSAPIHDPDDTTDAA